jgi:hypothetical protein
VRRILIFIIICFFISSQAFCAEISEWRTALTSGKFNKNSKKERQAIAQGLLDHLDQLNAYVPNLKPSELEWIDKEKQALDKLEGDAWMQKLMKIEWAPETHTKTIKLYLKAVLESLNEIVGNKDLTLREEVLCWAHIVLILIKDTTFNESLAVLEKNGRIQLTKDIKDRLLLADGKSVGLWVIYNLYGEYIQLYIVLPYLRGEISK